ncbi:hypothetical protein N9O56_02070 [Rickettsiales bacterium]|nr:hypothetical protein [Rickettsiales bacterium]
MNNSTEVLIDKIHNLIKALEKTDNSTINFYKIVTSEINDCITQEELKKVLDERLIHAGKITDFGGYNREQCDLFYEMWKVAKSICTNSEA